MIHVMVKTEKAHCKTSKGLVLNTSISSMMEVGLLVVQTYVFNPRRLFKVVVLLDYWRFKVPVPTQHSIHSGAFDESI